MGLREEQQHKRASVFPFLVFFLVSLFPSHRCRLCQTAEPSQQGVKPRKGRGCEEGWGGGARNQMIEGNLPASVLRDV